jgi:hypothetical protein
MRNELLAIEDAKSHPSMLRGIAVQAAPIAMRSVQVATAGIR